MANITVNSAEMIQFVDSAGKQSSETPTAVFQLGDWDAGSHVETGIMVDVSGAEAPLLNATNARKLAKWLLRAADLMDKSGEQEQTKKRNKPTYHEEDDDDNFLTHR